MSFHYVPCDLCGRHGFDLLIRDCRTLDGPLVRCHHCGLVCVNPRRTDFAVGEETQDPSGKRIAVWKEYAQVWDASLIPGEREIKHIHANARLRLGRLQKFARKGDLLDLGCGSGHFLSVARQGGFSVIGVEPNARTAEFGCRHYGLEIACGVLGQDALPGDGFGIVTMFHVIEHLPSPTRELEKIHRILRHQGLLFIETPTIDTVWFRLLRRHWRELIPDHYFFFGPQTIRLLLERRGFRVLEISSIGKRMSVQFFLSRLWRYSRRLTSILARLVEAMGVGDREIYLDLGDVMFVAAQKV